MSWFPFHYRDIKGWHDSGLPLTATSDTAAKLLDAALTEIILHDKDPVHGDFLTTMDKMRAEEPDMIMGNVVYYCYSIFGVSLRTVKKEIEDIRALAEKTKSLQLSSWERQHVQALVLLTEEDWLGAVRHYDAIVTNHPKDVHALQMSFGVYLYSGMGNRLRDIHCRASQYYDKQDRFYGNIHGKLCFGYEECGQYKAAEEAGLIALDHTPNDIWAIHSVVHVKQETLRYLDGLKFIDDTASQWQPRSGLVQHMWWHKALLNIESENYEGAVAIFDDHLLGGATRENNVFHLSDAVSLLLRLELEGRVPGVSLKDRWREVVQLYEGHVEGADANLFYDFHALVATLYGEKDAWAGRIYDLTTAVGDERRGWTSDVNRCLAKPLFDGLASFSKGHYDAAVEHLMPIRYDLAEKVAGSHAQKDVLNQVLVWSAIKSENCSRAVARQLVEERMADKVQMEPDYQNCLNRRMSTAARSAAAVALL